ncbi:MAG: zinc ribbon domain-containing protein [Desulfurococcales archaeon]|nr:zinc ribbon domain-containing protein [Desulfurococcales archaeon]
MAIFLAAAILVASIPLISASTAAKASDNPLLEGDEWAYTMTYINKTSGEKIVYLVYVVATSNGQLVRYEIYETNNPEPLEIIEYKLSNGMLVDEVKYTYPGSDDVLVFKYKANPPPLVVYPKAVGEHGSYESKVDMYYNGEYYASIIEEFTYQVTGLSKVERFNATIDAFMVTCNFTLIDPITGSIYYSSSIIYWINASFKLPLVEIHEDYESRTIYEMRGYNITPDPLAESVRPEKPEKYKLIIAWESAGDPSIDVPDATITVLNSTGIVAQVEIKDLPVTLSLSAGDYVVEVNPTEGTTVEGLGRFRFLEWRMGGQTIPFRLLQFTLNTSITITAAFEVYTLQNRTTTTVAGITTTIEPTKSTTTAGAGTTPTTTPLIIPGGASENKPYDSQATTTSISTASLGGLNFYLVIAGIAGVIAAGIGVYMLASKKTKRGYLEHTYQPSQPLPPPLSRSQHSEASIAHTSSQLAAQPPRGEETPPGPQARKICPNCGASLPVRAKYCTRCGTRLL